MKITSSQYAQTLYELTQGKSEDEVGVVVKKFAEMLKEKRQLNLLESIIKKFSEIWNKENGIVEVEAVSARELSDEQKNKIEEFVKSRYQAKEVALKNKVDKNIKGGIIVRVGDEVLDSSISRRLAELKKELVA